MKQGLSVSHNCDYVNLAARAAPTNPSAATRSSDRARRNAAFANCEGYKSLRRKSLERIRFIVKH